MVPNKLFIILLIFLIGCTTYNENDPDIIFAKSKCESNDYDCFLNASLERNNPNICWLLSASVDDMCMEDYYKISNDYSVCEKITKLGVRDNCVQYYENIDFPDVNSLTYDSWSDTLVQNSRLPNLDGHLIEYSIESNTFRGNTKFLGSGSTILNNEEYTNLHVETWGEMKEYENSDWQELPKAGGSTLKISTTSGNIAEENKILNYQEMESILLPTYTWMLAVDDHFKWKRTINETIGGLNIQREYFYRSDGREKFKGLEVFVIEEFSVDPTTNKIVEKTEYFVDIGTRIILKSATFNAEGKLVSQKIITNNSLFAPLND